MTCVLCNQTEGLRRHTWDSLPGTKVMFCDDCRKWDFPDSYMIGRLVGMIDEICGYIDDDNEHLIESFIDIWWEMRGEG